MPSKHPIDRRQLLTSALYTAGLLALGGCDNLARKSWFTDLLGKTEGLTRRAQRVLTPKDALAKEYRRLTSRWSFRPTATPSQGARSIKSLLPPTLLTGNWRSAGWLAGRPMLFDHGSSRHAFAHANHAARLRGGLECHRQVERGGPARHRREGGPTTIREVCRLSLRRSR